MAIAGYVNRTKGQGGVRTDTEKMRPYSNVYHSQITCSYLGSDDVDLLAIDDDEVLVYRGQRQKMRACSACPPALEWKWQDHAACLSLYPMVDMVTANRLESYGLIKEFCDTCPVQLECGEFALSRISEMEGIWGGVFIYHKNSPGRREDVQALQLKCDMLRQGDVA